MLNLFNSERTANGMKLSVSKTKVIVLSRNPAHCILYESGVLLQQVQKLKYLGSGSRVTGDTEMNSTVASSRLLQVYGNSDEP